MGIVKYYLKLKDTPIIGLYMTRMIVQKIYFTYEISTAFLDACEEALHIFKENFPLSTHDNVHYVMEEVKENMDLAINYIAEIEHNHRNVIQAVHTARAATVLLKFKKHQLKEMFEEGFVDESDYSALRKEIDYGLIEIQIHDFRLENVNFN